MRLARAPLPMGSIAPTGERAPITRSVLGRFRRSAEAHRGHRVALRAGHEVLNRDVLVNRVGAVTAAKPIPTQLAPGSCPPTRSRIDSTAT